MPAGTQIAIKLQAHLLEPCAVDFVDDGWNCGLKGVPDGNCHEASRLLIQPAFYLIGTRF